MVNLWVDPVFRPESSFRIKNVPNLVQVGNKILNVEKIEGVYLEPDGTVTVSFLSGEGVLFELEEAELFWEWAVAQATLLNAEEDRSDG